MSFAKNLLVCDGMIYQLITFFSGTMHNWSTDMSKFDRRTKAYKIWRVEQLVNYGLNGEKLPRADIKKYWAKLQLDPAKKRFLKFLLWE